MPIGESIKSALVPVLAFAMREFGSTVTIKRSNRTRTGTVDGASTQSAWAAVTGGSGIKAAIIERGRRERLAEWGTEVQVDAEIIVPDGPDLSTNGNQDSLGVVVDSGNYAGKKYTIVGQQVLAAGGVTICALEMTQEAL